METTYTQGIYINGTLYDVPLVSIKRTFDKLFKYSERDEESGKFAGEILGIYANFTMNFGIINDDDLYESLLEVLTSPIVIHSFRLPITKGFFNFNGYINSVSDEILKVETETAKFKGLTCKFIMEAPFRTP